METKYNELKVGSDFVGQVLSLFAELEYKNITVKVLHSKYTYFIYADLLDLVKYLESIKGKDIIADMDRNIEQYWYNKFASTKEKQVIKNKDKYPGRDYSVNRKQRRYNEKYRR